MYLDFTDAELKEIYPNYLRELHGILISSDKDKKRDLVETYTAILICAKQRISSLDFPRATQLVLNDIHSVNNELG